MAQIFHRSTNFIARFSVFSTLFLVGIALVAVLAVARSPYMTRQNITREQPVQFSHKHHVGDDGIDCRYCHTGVETRSEEHTSELQSRPHLVCRLLLEKKKRTA